MSRARLLAVLAALVAIGVALALPSPAAPPPPGPDGPVSLAQAWPSAVPTVLSAEVAGGRRFQPLDVLADGRLFGLTTSPDLRTVQLVLRDGSTLLVLRSITANEPPTIAATAVAGERLYWIETGEGGDGNREITVWTVPLAGGPPVRLARDFRDVLYYGSQYDLQVADGRVWWAALAPATTTRSEIHSVPVGGGEDRVQPMDRVFALTAYPWITSSGASLPGDVELRNLTTGERRAVTGAANEILSCTPGWCRITTQVDQGRSLRFEMERVDGTGRRPIGDTALMPLTSDIALLDRFEVLASLANTAGTAQRLWLHDLTTDRLVRLAESATANVGSRGGYLWWPTGDNETLTWHILDLRTLTP